ncbi:hypothetical protein [Parafrankia discariae]|uniref:hypothetical protein n=1 Tax=Parafrankia discariae TaxID=365528 RepID=UPI000375645E|nr:hypothetical protein [Parafrankia discariae]
MILIGFAALAFPVAASYADRVSFLVDGSFVEELVAPTTEGVLGQMKKLNA